MKAELILVVLAVLTNHIEAVCDPTDTEYTTCKTIYDVIINITSVTRIKFCAAAATFQTCAKAVLPNCETNAHASIIADATALKFVNCGVCDTADPGYTACKNTYYDVINIADVTRKEFCVAATTFKTCAKAVAASCETNVQTISSSDASSLSFTDCDVSVCDPSDVGYTTCKTTYDDIRNQVDVTRTDFCGAATTFKTCAKSVLPACEANAQTTITADTTTLSFTDCDVSVCDPSDVEYKTCKATYDDVRNKTEFCAAATTFKTCVKVMSATCEVNAQTIITVDATALMFVDCGVCDTADPGYTACKNTYYGVINFAGVTGNEFCVASTVFKTCAKTVRAICEINAQTTIMADTTALKFVGCGAGVCDTADARYTACKNTYYGVRNIAGVTRNEFCVAAITFKTCAKAVAASCETNVQTIITSDASSLSFTDCAVKLCDSQASEYTECKTAYGNVSTITDVTQSEFCSAATIFKTCVNRIHTGCATIAQDTITGDASDLAFNDCAVTTCDLTSDGYTTCKTAYDGVRNKQDVTETEFCAAAELFTTCAKNVLAACETIAQSTITTDKVNLKFTACGAGGDGADGGGDAGTAGISISLSLMVLACVAVLKNYL